MNKSNSTSTNEGNSKNDERTKEMAASKKETTKASGKNKTETVIYIGPSIKNVVESGTIFNNGLTPPLIAALENKPFLKGLLVPIDKLAKAKADLRKSDSAMSVLYKKAQI